MLFIAFKHEDNWRVVIPKVGSATNKSLSQAIRLASTTIDYKTVVQVSGNWYKLVF